MSACGRATVSNSLIFIFSVGFFVICTSSSLAAPVVVDTDRDGLSDVDEVQLYGTDEVVADTDGDGFLDGVEIKNGYSPLARGSVRLSDNDEDEDGMNDYLEIAFRTKIRVTDTDGDGFGDGQEIRAGYDPRTAESRKIEKRIAVDISDLRLTYYWDDVKMGTMPVSTGRKGYPTPVGSYEVQQKLPVHQYRGYPNTKWNLKFHGKSPGAYYIHGAYWHNEFGKKPMSGGCVNVAYKDIESLYAWADVGTKVVISK